MQAESGLTPAHAARQDFAGAMLSTWMVFVAASRDPVTVTFWAANCSGFFWSSSSYVVLVAGLYRTYLAPILAHSSVHSLAFLIFPPCSICSWPPMPAHMLSMISPVKVCPPVAGAAAWLWSAGALDCELVLEAC